MKTILSCLILFSICHNPIAAQTIEAGDILTKTTAIINAMPGNNGDDFQLPTAQELSDWEDLLVDLLAANYADADIKADALDYDVVQFTDNTNSEVYYILEKINGGMNYWGTYILNPNAGREEVVLMAPHPKFDFNTGKEAAYCFKIIDARFFMMSGTHRCNNSTASTCSGTTDACGASAPYRISDMAHVENTIWQLTTEYLFDHFMDLQFIQLHGFTKTISDPYVIMSNGTRQTPALDLITSIRDELLLVDPVLTFRIAHIDLDWDRLIGFSNTNGRYINSSSDICMDNAVNTSGRFVHIEQEKTRLRDNMNGWHKMAVALAETFPGPAVLPLPVALAAFDGKINNAKTMLSWTTFSERDNDFFEIEKSMDGHIFYAIGKVDGHGNSTIIHEYNFEDTPENGINYYRLRQVDFDGNWEYSKVVQLTYKAAENPIVYVYISENKLTIHIHHGNDGELYFQLFDVLGREVAASIVSDGENIIPVSFAHRGVGFYRLKSEKQVVGAGVLLLGN